uniref:Soluble Rieske-type ferredoxin domain-containing protein n=1 Tax=Periophthalmus magnuspinnatus TaxID=409849 RepID=A0A3B4AQS1_9GOBI
KCDRGQSLDSHYIGRKEDIVRAGRVTRVLNGCRDVLILHHQGQIYAMDMRCYRELHLYVEFNSRLCIGLYQAVDNPTVTPLWTEWRSKGVKQRIHQVTVVKGHVYVTLNTHTEEVESDRYQSHKHRTRWRSQKLFSSKRNITSE